MSSMVGGKDVIFETARHGFEIRPVLEAVDEFWPDARFQDAEEDAVRRLSAVLADQAALASREFFVYKDDASAQSWDREGWTEGHGNDMAHFLVVDDAARPEVTQLTLVIGAVTGETTGLVNAVFDALERMSLGDGSHRGRSRRVDWETELGAVGCPLGREQFYEKVEELQKALYSEWTADELACHPHEALQFCEVVRRKVGAPVPDHLVMKALMNRRRQGKKRRPGSFEPRLLWGA